MRISLVVAGLVRTSPAMTTDGPADRLPRAVGSAVVGAVPILLGHDEQPPP